MRGFKVLSTKMLERNDETKWELGKWHTVHGDLSVHNAAHRLCATFETAILSAARGGRKIFACETGEEIIADNNYYIARDIRLIREVDTQTIKTYLTANFDRLFDNGNERTHGVLAKYGVGLEKLVDDPSPYIRRLVAKNGYALDKLINDADFAVRIGVAQQRYGLDKLVDDEDWRVRDAVARQGYRLDKLIDDENWWVRATVARQGYRLDKLVDDEDWRVLAAVAEQGYRLDNAPSVEARNAVQYSKCMEMVDKSEEIFNKYCKDLTEEQKELARKCTESLLNKGIELYERGLQSFVSTLKG